MAAAPVIGAAGGSVNELGGATVVVPAGALETATTIRVAMDSTGAPALPAGLPAAGNTYVVTPHGGEFAQAVEVRIPAPNVSLLPNQELKLAKAQPGGEWEVLGDSVLRDGALVAQVGSFSFFVPVTVTYLLPMAQLAPLQVSSSLTCGDRICDPALGTVTATYAITTNGGQLPNGCTTNQLIIQLGSNPNYSPGATGSTNVPLSGGSMTRTLTPRSPLYFTAGARCSGTGYHLNFGLTSARRVFWSREPAYPNLAVMRAPTQLDVVPGLSANLDVILAGGAAALQNDLVTHAIPTAANRAVIDWQRSDDNGASWRPIARSYQNEANPNPVGADLTWKYWSVRHGFIAAGADQGALLRVHACYTPPDVATPPCVTGPPTRLNVLQQSALPAIVDAPRSVLVRTGQTASLSATFGGAPAPTLQWQTRAANASGAWANVSGGTGAGTGNYTTAVMNTADNGTQYRVLATNALGSAESAPVTVSVSDLDVAPVITTQPAALSVTEGNDAAFAIAARGTEALSYQWSKDGVAINGANSPVLRLPAVSAGQAGAYSVTASNGAGTAVSNAATLTVSAGTAAPVAPSIVTQPVSVLVNAGNTATFAVGASGSGTLGYQWLRDGQPIVGATAAFHSIAQAAVGDAGTYAVQVSNGTGPGVRSFNVVLTVNASQQPTPVSLLTQPSPQVQAPGGSATFAVGVTGSGPVSYQWLKNGAPVPGASTAVLTLLNITGGDAADYSVTVSNALLTVTSTPARLTVLGAPLISAQPAATNASAGSSATFSVSASGDAVRYQWTRNQVAIGGATSASHTTPALTLSDSGAVYGVVVYNGAGVALSQGAVLTVSVAPAAAQWQTAQALRPDDGTSAEWVVVTAGASGQFAAAWQDIDASGNKLLRASRYAPGSGWSAAETVAAIDAPNAAPRHALVMDPTGNAVLVFISRSNLRLSVWASRQTPTGPWSAPVLLETEDGGHAELPALAIDAQGLATAVWQQNDTVFFPNLIATRRIVASRFVPSLGWEAPVDIDFASGGNGTGLPLHVATSPGGDVVAAWTGDSPTGQMASAAVRRAGAGWSSAQRLLGGTTPTTATTVGGAAINDAGVALVTFRQLPSVPSNVYAARYVPATGWGTPVFLGPNGDAVRVLLAPDGAAVVAWDSVSGNSIYAVRATAAGVWEAQSLVGGGFGTQIGRDDAGNVTLVFSDIPSPRRILSARWPAGGALGAAGVIESATTVPSLFSFGGLAVSAGGQAAAVWVEGSSPNAVPWVNVFR